MLRVIVAVAAVGLVVPALGARDLPPGAVAIYETDSYVSHFALSPNGRLLAVGTWEEMVVFDTSTGERLCTLRDSVRHFPSVAFDRWGNFLMVGLSSGVEESAPDLLIMDVGDILRRSSGYYCPAPVGMLWMRRSYEYEPWSPRRHEVFDFMISPLGDWLVCCTPGCINVFDVAGCFSAGSWSPPPTGSDLVVPWMGERHVVGYDRYPYTSTDNTIRAVCSAVNRFGTTLAVGGQMQYDEPTIQLHDLTQRYPSEIYGPRYLGDQSLIGSGRGFGDPSLVINARSAHRGYVECLAFDPTGTIVVSGESAFYGTGSWCGRGHRFCEEPTGRPTSVALWDTSTGGLIRTMEMSEHTITSVAFAPGGQLLAAIDSYGLIKVWCASSGEELLTLKPRSDDGREIAFDPSGAYLLSAHYSHVLQWELPTWLTDSCP